MARIKLQIPADLPYSTRLPIRITDINYGNHLGNDAVLSLIHEARMQFLASKGLKELDAHGVDFIMADCAIVYKSEGFYGQQLIVQVGAGDYSSAGFDLYYRFVVEDTGKELALAKTGMVCFDYANRKVVQVPEALKADLGDVLEQNAAGE